MFPGGGSSVDLIALRALRKSTLQMRGQGMGRVRTVANLGAVLVLSLACVVLAACGSDSSGDNAQPEDLADAERGFVGTVEGTNAFVALLASDGEAVFYVCDGTEDIAEWFAGPVEETEIDLSNDAGARVEATASDGGYAGTVTLADGGRHRFQAVPAQPGAGLLRITGPEAEADGVVAGWIVTNDGEQRGSLRVRGVTRAAPAAPGESVTLSGTKYSVSIFLIPPPQPPAPFVPVPYPNIGVVATATR